MLIKTVLAFRSNVNTKTDMPSDPIIVKAFLLLKTPSPPFESEPPTITGKSGSMHGARTVSTPAINEIISRNIYYFNSETKAVRVGLPLHFLISLPSPST